MIAASAGVYLRPGMVVWVPYGYIPMVSTVSSLAVAIVQPVFSFALTAKEPEVFSFVAKCMSDNI